MNGTEKWLEVRDKIRNNQLLGPNTYMCGPAISIKATKLFTSAKTPSEGRAKVNEQINMGFDFIKVYTGLSKETFEAIIDEAKKNNVKVFGHVPRSVPLSQALRDMNSTEHHTGYFLYPENILADKDYMNLVKGANAWICPTMATSLFNMREPIVDDTASYPEMKYISPYLKREWASEPLLGGINRANFNNPEHKAFLPNLARAKAKFLAGTDAGALKNMVPGFTLIREIKKMTGIGLSNYEALKTATINPAQAMGKESEMGTVEVGKRADLLLLSRNPLDNIENIKQKKGVMVKGIWLSDIEIKSILSRIEQIYKTD
jgi:imidazolonepropionase-like amidohydrolase